MVDRTEMCRKMNTNTGQEILWRSSGWGSVLSLPRPGIPSLVRELRPCRLTKNENKKQIQVRMWQMSAWFYVYSVLQPFRGGKDDV